MLPVQRSLLNFPKYLSIIENQESPLYHRPGCPSYEQIALENRVEFASEREAEAAEPWFRVRLDY